MFVCIEVESEHYLLADINIKCYSPYWYKGVLYASLMIFIYPVGIPMSYLWLLYQVKNDIVLKNIHPSVRQGSVKINKYSENNNNSNDDDYNNNNNDDDNTSKKSILIKHFNSDLIDYNINHNDDNNNGNNSNDKNNNYNNDNTANVFNDDYNVCDQTMISNSPITSSKHHKMNNTSLIEVKSIRFLWEPYQEKYW
jgi:hypothetical protein